MILHIYFAKRFIVSLLILGTVIIGLAMMVNFIEQTRRFENLSVSVSHKLGLTLLYIPTMIIEFLPLIMILGTVAFYMTLGRSSELIVTRAAGQSTLRAIIAPAIITSLIGLFAVTILGPVALVTFKRYSQLTELYKSDDVLALSVSERGLWLRQSIKDEHTVIRANHSNNEATIFHDVTFVKYGPTGLPVTRTEAKSATIIKSKWVLRDAKVWQLANGLNPEANARTYDVHVVPSTLTLDRIRESLGSDMNVSIWKMSKYIQQLEQAGFSTKSHYVWLQSQFAQPLFLVGLVLVAAALTIRHTGFGKTSFTILFPILMGFSLYFIQNFAQVLGESGQIPVLLAVWTPPIASILLAIGFLLRADDG
ncbi:MAG: LPS export ABC transporter permease LptG [Tateyamaria sp.]|nr:LPS export ABC transporter permease LptG [Tateyamaria sp.]